MTTRALHRPDFEPPTKSQQERLRYAMADMLTMTARQRNAYRGAYDALSYSAYVRDARDDYETCLREAFLPLPDPGCDCFGPVRW